MAAPQIPFHAPSTHPAGLLARPRVPSQSRLARLQQFIAQKSPSLGAITSRRIPKRLGFSNLENGAGNTDTIQPEFLLEGAAPPTHQQQFHFPGPVASLTLPPPATPSGKRIAWIRSLVPERLRTPQACERCRVRKTKCTGSRPTCKRCFKSGVECVYVLDHKNNRLKAKKAKLRGAETYAYDDAGNAGSGADVLLSMNEVMGAQAAMSLANGLYNVPPMPSYPGLQAPAPSPLEVFGAAIPEEPVPAYLDVNPFDPSFSSAASSGPAVGAGQMQWFSRPGYSRRGSSQSSSKSRHSSARVHQRPSKSRQTSTWTIKPSQPPPMWGSSSSFVLLEAERSTSKGSSGASEFLPFAPSNSVAGSNTNQAAPSSAQVPGSAWELVPALSSFQDASPTALEELEAERALAEELERELAAIGIADGDQEARFLPIPSYVNLSGLAAPVDVPPTAAPPVACTSAIPGMGYLSVPQWSYDGAEHNTNVVDTWTPEDAQFAGGSELDNYLAQMTQPDQVPSMDMDVFQLSSSLASAQPPPSDGYAVSLTSAPAVDMLDAELTKCMAEIFFPMPVVAGDFDYYRPPGWLPEIKVEVGVPISQAVDESPDEAEEIPPSASLNGLWVELFGDEPDA